MAPARLGSWRPWLGNVQTPAPTDPIRVLTLTTPPPVPGLFDFEALRAILPQRFDTTPFHEHMWMRRKPLRGNDLKFFPAAAWGLLPFPAAPKSPAGRSGTGLAGRRVLTLTTGCAMTVRQLRELCEQLERQGRGDTVVRVCCDTDPDTAPDGHCGYGVTVYSDLVLLDYTSEPDMLNDYSGQPAVV